MGTSSDPPSTPSVTDKASLVNYIDDHLDQVVSRHQAAVEPVWREQSEVGKTLITLASGALVLSASVAQVFADKIGHLSWLWLLPSSWVLFALTALMGASRQAWSSQAQSFALRLEMRRQSIIARLWDMNLEVDVGRQIDVIIQEELRDADATPRRALRVHDGLGMAMYFAFAFGLVALMTFGIRNLPW
jgi:hypothetical protein